jgi:hypothetical protein
VESHVRLAQSEEVAYRLHSIAVLEIGARNARVPLVMLAVRDCGKHATAASLNGTEKTTPDVGRCLLSQAEEVGVVETWNMGSGLELPGFLLRFV